MVGFNRLQFTVRLTPQTISRYNKLSSTEREVAAVNLMNRLERALYRLRVAPFFRFVVLAMAGVYVLDLFFPAFGLIGRMDLVAPMVFRGQVWRLVTFLLVPPLSASILQVALMLYFYYFVGTALEGRWGARRFLLFYLIGAAAALAAGLLTGIGTNEFLNLSLFFAFAIQYPDFELLLFFMIPIKVKWLALLNGVFYIYRFINGSWPVRAAILASLVNIVLFFGGDLLNLARTQSRQWKRRQQFRRNSR